MEYVLTQLSDQIVLARYQLGSLLEQSDLCCVYQAQEIESGEPVFAWVGESSDNELKARHHEKNRSVFLHPLLLELKDHGYFESFTVMIAEPLSGWPSAKGLAPCASLGQSVLPETEALQVILQLLMLLDYLQAYRVYVPQLTPAMLFWHHNQLKLFQPDLAFFEANEHPVFQEILAHASDYLAPECILGKPMTSRSLVYTVAFLALRLMTGQIPFDIHSQRFELKREAQSLVLVDRKGHLSPAVLAIFSRCLAIEPENRYESLMALAGDLAEQLTLPLVLPSEHLPLATQLGQQVLSQAIQQRAHTMWLGAQADHCQVKFFLLTAQTLSRSLEEELWLPLFKYLQQTLQLVRKVTFVQKPDYTLLGYYWPGPPPQLLLVFHWSLTLQDTFVFAAPAREPEPLPVPEMPMEHQVPAAWVQEPLWPLDLPPLVVDEELNHIPEEVAVLSIHSGPSPIMLTEAAESLPLVETLPIPEDISTPAAIPTPAAPRLPLDWADPLLHELTVVDQGLADWQQQLPVIASRLDRTLQQIAKQQQQFVVLERELASAADNFVALQNRHLQLEQQLSDYQTLNREHQTLEQEYQTLNREHQTLEQEYQTLNREHQTLEQEYQTGQTQAQSRQDQFQDFRQRLEAVLKDLNRQLSHKEDEAAAAQRECQLLNNQLQTLRQQEAQARQQASQAEDYLQELREELEEHERRQENVVQRQKIVQTQFETDMGVYEEYIAELEASQADFGKQAAAFQQKIAGLTTDVARLETATVTYLQERADNAVIQKRLEAERGEHLRQISLLNNQISILNNIKAQHEAEIAESIILFQQQQQQILVLQERANHTEQQKIKGQESLFALQRFCESWETQLDDHQHQLSQQEQRCIQAIALVQTLLVQQKQQRQQFKTCLQIKDEQIQVAQQQSEQLNAKLVQAALNLQQTTEQLTARDRAYAEQAYTLQESQHEALKLLEEMERQERLLQVEKAQSESSLAQLAHNWHRIELNNADLQTRLDHWQLRCEAFQTASEQTEVAFILDLNKLKQQQAVLEQELILTRNENQQLRQERDDARQIHVTQSAQIQSMASQLQELQQVTRQQESQQQELHYSRKEITRLRQERESLKADLQDVTEFMTDIEAQIENIQQAPRTHEWYYQFLVEILHNSPATPSSKRDLLTFVARKLGLAPSVCRQIESPQNQVSPLRDLLDEWRDQISQPEPLALLISPAFKEQLVQNRRRAKLQALAEKKNVAASLPLTSLVDMPMNSMASWPESVLTTEKLTLPAMKPLAGMVYIAAGDYPIGNDRYTSERPAHRYHTDGYWIDVYPVSNADFHEFIQDGGYRNPDWWPPEGWRFISQKQIPCPAFWNKAGYFCGQDYPEYPVIGVSLFEALAFAAWAHKRLPTEVEWEIAARGSQGWQWPWGNEWQENCANTSEAGLMNIAPIGKYSQGKSWSGCHDMIGNVLEWTPSLYVPYPYLPHEGREDLRKEGNRTLRGGSWSYSGPYTRSSSRFFNLPFIRHSDIGFRCVKNAPPPRGT